MTMPYAATEKQLELRPPGVSEIASLRRILRRRVARKHLLFEAREHVRKLTRSGQVEYQYRREVNPKPLRPVAQKLFGRWSVVRALHTEADYHTAALEYDAMVARCREMIEAEGNITMIYRGPMVDPYLSRSIIAARLLGPDMTLRWEGLPSKRVAGTTPYSTEKAIESWANKRTRVTKPQSVRNKRTKMEHYYAWAKREGRTTQPFIDPPKGYNSKGGSVDGKVADLTRDDLTQITSADLRAYRDHLVARRGNNYAIDHVSDMKVLLTDAFDEEKFGPNGTDPGASVKLPGKREKGGRNQYTDDEVRRILDALPGDPVIEWPTKIMAYLGLITEEIADATTHDVTHRGDMVVLHVRDDHRKLDDGQTNELKEKQRERNLPLHPAIAEGFWTYAESVRREYGGGPLFPMVVPNRDGLRSGKIGRATRDFIKELGIAATPYSFRHRFATYLNDIQGLSDDTRRYMTGHKPKDVLAASYLHHHPEKLTRYVYAFDPMGRLK